MNKYPVYLKNEPKPLVFLIGSVENEPDIHTKLIRVVETNIRETDGKDQPVILFRSVSADYNFPEKKPQKEHLSTEGILKHNWPSKHFELIPSVVIFAVSFSVDWGATEWQRREYIIHDKYNRLKSILSPRDIKLILVVVRIGAGSIEKDVVDERISSLKRHLPLDSKSFIFISPSELTVDNVYMKKISKSVRESSSLFYSTRIKQLKSVQKSITEKQYKGAVESILHARYNFKIAFYYEFQGQAGQSLRYYRLCYEALALSVETVDEELFEQVKTVAEMAHFKVCNMLLYATSVIESFQQFRTHMNRFSKLYSEHPWKHYAWVSDQYVVFAQLLELYAVNDSLPDADRAFYYHNAARYSQKRQMSFEKMRKEMDSQKGSSSTVSSEAAAATRNSVTGRELYRGMVLMPPRFIGASSQILDPVLDQLQPGSEESQRLFTEYSLDQEYRINHGAVVMGLVTLALERTNGNFKRRKGFILSLIAEQNIKEENYSLAMRHLCTASELLTSEGWVAPSVAILGLIMKCAILLGRPLEYLNAALTLYANASHLFLSRYEIEDLHLNILSLLEATLANTNADCKARPLISEDCFQYNKLCVRNKSAFLTSSFVSLIDRPEYGSAAVEEEGADESRAVEFCLDEAHRVVDMSAGKKMFHVDVAFSSATVELGQKLSVTLSLTSRFMDEMVFDEMRVHFTDGAIVKRFVGSHRCETAVQCEAPLSAVGVESGGGVEENIGGVGAVADSNHFLMRRLASSEDVANQFGSSNKDEIHAPLVFPPGKKVQFEFLIYISESGFASFLNPEAVLCLERVELVLFQTPLSSTSSEVIDEDLKVVRSDEDEVVAAPSPMVREVVFDVAAFPEVVLKARKGPGKPLSLKDVVRYCFNEGYPTITIQKPSALISMVKPAPNRDVTTLLQGVVQRVNVFLKVGACDMLDACVYLASDFTPSSSSEALFWYPDREALEGALQRGREGPASDRDLDEVPFHALLLNDAMQPSQPLSLGSVCAAGSTLFLPLFVISRFAGAISVKLRVEYVPRGRLKSSLSKEFVVKLNFIRALDVSHSIVSGGVTHDNHTATVFAGESSLLVTTLTCVNSLQYSLGVADVRLQLNPDLQTGGDKSLLRLLGGPSENEYDMLHSCESKTSVESSASFPVWLRKNDCFSESVYLHCDENLVTTENSLSSSSKSTGTSATAVSMGRVRVQWRLLKKHVLRHTCGKGESQERSGDSRTSWLPKLGHRSASQDSNPLPLDLSTSKTAIGVSFFDVPPMKVTLSPFVVEIDVPAIAELGQVLAVRLLVTSRLHTSERMRLTVGLSDHFLIAGCSTCIVEVPAHGEFSTCVTVIPLRCGSLALPPMSLLWDRPGTSAVKLLETTNQEMGPAGQHVVYVHPLAVAQ